MDLYFIALIPPIHIRELIKSLKTEMMNLFHAQHALNSPGHITLQRPFRIKEEELLLLIKIIRSLASNQVKFNIHLNGFGCFAPRVIFVNVKNPDPITALHHSLKKSLLKNKVINSRDITDQINPHMTIATRDLTVSFFNKAWESFKTREFKQSFFAKSIFLLKHNGKHWDIYKEFPFSEHNSVEQ